MTRALGVVGALLAIAVPSAACGQSSSPAGTERVQLHLRKVVGGLDSPVYVTAVKSEPSKLYVVEQPGVIRVLVNGKLQAQPFLDIRNRVTAGGEQGLLSVAFHPRYAKNHRFFVYFNDTSGDVRVYEFRSNGSVGLPASGKPLLRVGHREFSNHNGGQLQFGPDGRLYAGTGDGGSGGDPHNHAQSLGSRLGKLLRLNVDRRGARWQIAGYGLRNPWRFSFDRATRDLYIGDVGQGAWEEVDVRTPRQWRGLNNYGWRVWEARSRYTPGQKTNRRGRLVFPIARYSHSQGCSITGGYVYRGRAIPGLRGRYIYGDYCSGTVWTLRSTGAKLRSGPRREGLTIANLSSFGEDAAGELYATSLDGALYRITR